MKRLAVSFVTSEVDPFSKTGGLADVSHALPAALAELGHDVTVFSPYYRSAAAWASAHAVAFADAAGPDVAIGAARHPLRYRVAERDGYRLVFAANDAFYDRDGLYLAGGRDHPDNAARFAFLCRAVLEYHLAVAAPPAILHANDWQGALIPAYLRTLYAASPLAAARCVFTVHNLAYQGTFPPEQLAVTGLDAGLFHPEGLEFYGQLNLMKAGLLFADAITTVSPSYAAEIQTAASGCGLDGVLRAQRHKLRGIVNGIDTRRWNPASDPHLAAPYDAERLAGKAACKDALQEHFGLPRRRDAFLLGVVSRLDVQKGIPLVADAFAQLAGADLQLAVFGTGDAATEQRLRELAQSHPARVAVRIGFDEALAHQIESGADAFLMPSAYEPCGLNQMYSQRYGTIPIVHATGGLRDTVTDYSPAALRAGTASGFAFAPLSAAELAAAIGRAHAVFRDDPDEWRALMRQCMRIDNSWAHSARAYAQLYRELIAAS